MTLLVEGDTIFASGPVADDYLVFKNALSPGTVRRIVFINSPGGDLWTGMRIGRMIADNKLDTVIAGNCISACSIMFMGGDRRTFSDAFKPSLTYIGIHGPSSKITKAVIPEQAGQIFAFLRMRMGERFNANLMNKALYDMDDAGGLLRVFDTLRKPVRLSYHCKSGQTPRKDCVEFKDADAVNLGIVTSEELTKLNLPIAMRETPAIGGYVLERRLADIAAFAQEISGANCKSESCRKSISEYPDVPESKAIAIPVNDSGYGYSRNSDTYVNAYFGALAACNHIKGKLARLCEVQSVNDFDLRGHLALAESAHSNAVKAIIVPGAKYFADEEFSSAFANDAGIRSEKYIDATPKNANGIQTIGTQDLAKILIGSNSSLLLSVVYGESAIPGSQVLIAGGLAFSEADKETRMQSQFEGLLRALGATPERPVIFYSQSRNDWYSLNAALRARKAGYTQVSWYRGGLEAWKAASLPLAPAIFRAVAF